MAGSGCAIVHRQRPSFNDIRVPGIIWNGPSIAETMASSLARLNSTMAVQAALIVPVTCWQTAAR